MNVPRLGHLTDLPLALRYPLAAWFSLDRTSIWVLSDGLVSCSACETMRAVFQLTRRAGRVEARCLSCAKEPHEADAPATAHATKD